MAREKHLNRNIPALKEDEELHEHIEPDVRGTTKVTHIVKRREGLIPRLFSKRKKARR